MKKKVLSILFCLMFAFSISTIFTGCIPTFVTTPKYISYQIVSPSMVDSGFETGEIVLIKILEEDDELFEGDIILFNVNNRQIFHHIHEVIDNGDGSYSYRTKGSSNPTIDPYIVTRDMIIGIYEPTI